MRVDGIGPKFRGSAEVRQRIDRLMLCDKQSSQQKIGRKVVGLELEGQAEFRFCIGGTRRALVHQREIKVHEVWL